MQVSGSESYNYSPIQGVQKPQDPTQEQKDLALVKVKSDSVNAQIDAYVAGTEQYNETSTNYENSNDYTQNYNEFAQNVRQANNLAILVENGVERPEDPSIEPPIAGPVSGDLDQAQKDTLRQGIVSVAGYQSTESQIDAYKAGSAQANNAYNDTAQSIDSYNQFAADARKSEALNTYVDYNNYLVG
jgi:hypothetical protein